MRLTVRTGNDNEYTVSGTLFGGDRPRLVGINEIPVEAELSEHIYEQVVERDSNVIEVLINHLRNKLSPDLIKTRRGLGYQLVMLGDDQ
mgnify:CR=1 FL=1